MISHFVSCAIRVPFHIIREVKVNYHGKSYIENYNYFLNILAVGIEK